MGFQGDNQAAVLKIKLITQNKPCGESAGS